MSQIEITFAGVGGQGSILAGVILGTAAVAYDDKYSVQTQGYSSELRGGYAATWVIVSDEPVDFPRVTSPDILVAQAPDAIRRFAPSLKPTGLLIMDSDMISAAPAGVTQVLRIPATSVSRNQMKAPVVANMIMLGALCQATGVVSREALEKAIVEFVPGNKYQVNLDAFHWGMQAAENQADQA